MRPKHIKQLQRQSKKLTVRRIDRHTLSVESATLPDARYRVIVSFMADHTIQAQCNCPWAKNRGFACSHVMAALEFLAAQKGRILSFWPTREDAARQKQRVFYLPGRTTFDEGVWITSRAG